MVVHAIEITPSTKSAARVAPKDRAEYRLYMAILFPLSLVAVLFGRMFGVRRARRRATGRLNAWAEAMELTRRAVPWAFMGR